MCFHLPTYKLLYSINGVTCLGTGGYWRYANQVYLSRALGYRIDNF